MTSSTAYEVFNITGAGHAILCDPDSRSTDLGFSQSVAIDRLARYDLCNLKLSIDADKPAEIEVSVGELGAWRRGTIVSWSGTGKGVHQVWRRGRAVLGADSDACVPNGEKSKNKKYTDNKIITHNIYITL